MYIIIKVLLGGVYPEALCMHYQQFIISSILWGESRGIMRKIVNIYCTGVGGAALLISDPIPFLLQMYCLEGSTLICEYVNKEINQISD